MYVVVLSENDLILANLNDLVSVSEGFVWAIDSQLTQVNLRITFGTRTSCIYVWCIVSVYISLLVVLRIQLGLIWWKDCFLVIVKC